MKKNKENEEHFEIEKNKDPFRLFSYSHHQITDK